MPSYDDASHPLLELSQVASRSARRPAGVDVLELADMAMERDGRRSDLEVIAGQRDDIVPAQHPLAQSWVVVAQTHVERGQRRLVDPLELAFTISARIGAVCTVIVPIWVSGSGLTPA